MITQEYQDTTGNGYVIVHGALQTGQKEERVAPHVGAWIETSLTMRSAPASLVAPHVGAWIETAESGIDIRYRYCRPSRRGVD